MSVEDTQLDNHADTVQKAPGYVDPEFLRATADLLEQCKRRSYELLRLQPGHHVLDLGCGPATDTITLAGLVGPTGAVVGVDHDPAMVAEANQRAAAAGVEGWTRHIAAEATLLPFDSASFDRVRAERVFQHLPRAEAAFGELVRVARPGGWIGVLDSDWGTLSIDCTHIDLERRYVRFLSDGFARNGYAGRRLYSFFVGHRLEDVVVETYPVHFTSYASARYTLLADRLEPAAVAAGALTLDEVDRLRREWEQADANGCFFASMHMIAAFGRRS